jgi:hypothetical protein
VSRSLPQTIEKNNLKLKSNIKQKVSGSSEAQKAARVQKY